MMALQNLKNFNVLINFPMSINLSFTDLNSKKFINLLNEFFFIFPFLKILYNIKNFKEYVYFIKI